MTIKIMLSGSYGASAEGIALDTGKRYSDPVPVLCRKLIRAGHDPATFSVVLRDGTAVFKAARTLAQWAAWSIKDREAGGFRRDRHTDPDRVFPSPASAPVSGRPDASGTVTPPEALAVT